MTHHHAPHVPPMAVLIRRQKQVDALNRRYRCFERFFVPKAARRVRRVWGRRRNV